MITKDDSMLICDVLVFCRCYDLFVTSLQDDTKDDSMLSLQDDYKKMK
jgi:hypothetical protein